VPLSLSLPKTRTEPLSQDSVSSTSIAEVAGVREFARPGWATLFRTLRCSCRPRSTIPVAGAADKDEMACVVSPPAMTLAVMAEALLVVTTAGLVFPA